MKKLLLYSLLLLVCSSSFAWTPPADPVEPGYHRLTLVASPAEAAATLTGSDDYLDGTNIVPMISQTPAGGYRFVGWYVGGAPLSASYTLSANVTIEARYVSTRPAGIEMVDLGLSVKWANMNVGATAPEGVGEYYAWGETAPKAVYLWDTYLWCDGSEDSMTKYCTSSSYGTVDNKTTLDPADDAARANWGGSWRMPTPDEWTELIDNCTWTWITQNGMKGYRVTGTNGNSIFLPAAGYKCGKSLHYNATRGYYWSSTLADDGSGNAWRVLFNGSEVTLGRGRYYGRSVRPVCP